VQISGGEILGISGHVFRNPNPVTTLLSIVAGGRWPMSVNQPIGIIDAHSRAMVMFEKSLDMCLCASLFGEFIGIAGSTFV